MNNKGQSLLEALVALGAAVIIVSAVAIAVITSVNNADYSKVQNQATAYAQEEMEILHQQSRADWNTFNSLPISFTEDIGNSFKRQVDIVHNSLPTATDCPNVTKVTVSVSWKDGRCLSGVFCHSTKLESCFTNINALPTP